MAVDTPVLLKHIAYPTDADLVHKVGRKIVEKVKAIHKEVRFWIFGVVMERNRECNAPSATIPDAYAFDGVDILSFSEQRDTPFYLISERGIISAYERILSHLNMPAKKIFYSLKTNYETPVLKTLKSLGSGVEVYRETEFQIALDAGFQGSEIIMDGPCKTRTDLEIGLKNNVFMINVESYEEMELLNNLAKARGVVQHIGVRVHLDISQYPNVFNYIALKRSRPFGFYQSDVECLFGRMTSMKNIQLTCISGHATTPVALPHFFGLRIKLLFKLAALARKNGHPVSCINIGGGFPSEDSIRHKLPVALGTLPIVSFFFRSSCGLVMTAIGEMINETYGECVEKYNFEPALFLEPGRYIVDDSMIVVGRVVQVNRRAIFVDVSAVTELGYQSQFLTRKVVILKRGESKSSVGKWKICGPTQFPYDIIATSFSSEAPEPGDLAVIHNVGAYCTCSSRPFMQPRCACYFIDRSSNIHLSRRKETYRDMIHTQTEYFR